MLTDSPRLPSMICLWGLLVAGCNTSSQANRIAELQSQYEQMPPSTQEVLAKGAIEMGNTPEMVYIALGRPDEIETSADTQNTTWIYRNFYPSAKVVSQPLYSVPNSNPLDEVRAAWIHNLPTHPEIDPSYPAKRSDESWADYAKKHPAQSQSTNRLEQETYEVRAEARRPEIDNANREALTLEVLFHRQQVVDAIINGSVSAFSVPQ